MSTTDEFELPGFLQNDTDADSIEERMMSNLPEDIDKTEGGFPWDFTMPTAIELSQVLGFYIPETLKIMYPMWAYGRWLDLHGRVVGLTRKPAVQAKGRVTVTGKAGTYIVKGFRFAVPTDGTAPSVEFETDESAEIGEEEVITINVTAVEAGKTGNVAAGTISMMSSPMRGITNITNEEDTTGGTEEESDDDFRERILEAYRRGQTSFIGNDADYIRWSKEVPGIGDCVVISAYDGPGTVKLVLIDSNGDPANESLCQAVFNHIVSPDDRMKRLLPTACAKLACVPATTVVVNFQCIGLQYDNTTDIEQIKADFSKLVMMVYSVAKLEGVLRYNDVRPLFADIPGVEDFEEFYMDGGIENIELAREDYPKTGTLDFS